MVNDTDANGGSTPKDGQSSPEGIDPGAVKKARQISLDGTGEEAEFVAPPEQGMSPSPGEDPALDGRPELTLEEKQEEWQNFLSPVVKAVATTADIFVPDFPGLDRHEEKQLAEVWGNVLGHYHAIKRGTEAGDWARAVGETSAISMKKLQAIRESQDQSDEQPPENKETAPEAVREE